MATTGTLALLDHTYESWRRHRDEVLWRWLEPRLTSLGPGRLLKTDLYDEAVSEGFLRRLGALGWHAVGIDQAVHVVAAARRRCAGAPAIAATVLALPLPAGRLDGVVSLSTLDHFASVAELDRSLAELKRVLRPEGRLLLTLDNLDNPVVRLRNALPEGPLRATGLVPYKVGVTLGKQELCAAVRRAGFEIVTVSALLHCPRALMVALCRASTRLADSFAGRRAGSRGEIPVPWGDRALGAAIRRCEVMARLPSRWRTGYYLALEARTRI